ncbi:hypothetical protein [Caballeronia sp. 15711]
MTKSMLTNARHGLSDLNRDHFGATLAPARSVSPASPAAMHA